MNRNDFYVKQMFSEGQETQTTDVEPAISIDVASRFAANINVLRQALGITRMIPMAEGTVIKMYKDIVGEIAEQVGEGEEIGLTKVSRVLAKTIDLTLRKDRRRTTAEAIQKSGRAIAINEMDDKLISKERVKIKEAFFDTITEGTGTATPIAPGLQAALAAVWGALKVRFEDEDVTPIYFVNPMDVSHYLAKAPITTQSIFGLDYVENFLGVGRAFISAIVPQGTVIGTATENLNGAYVPASGDIAQIFGLTYDESGLIGVKHALVDANLSVDTIIVDGVVFWAEDLSGIFKATITNE